MKCYKDVGIEQESFGTIGNQIIHHHNELKWMGIDIPRDNECKSCKFLPICLGGCTKQWQKNASKDVICTPLKYNYGKLFPLNNHSK